METLVKYPEKYFHEWEERVVFILKSMRCITGD